MYPPLSQAEPSYEELGNYVPLKFHVAFLAYVKGASLKPDPEINVCKSLAAEILRDGFSTSGEPLLLKQCDGEDVKATCISSTSGEPLLLEHCNPLPAHSMGYIKGQSRGLTLLALLHVVFQDGFLDLATYLPAFYHSVLVVFGQVMAPMSVPDQVVLNFTLSVKGSIRKQPSVISWVTMLDKVRRFGVDDFDSLIKRFNARVSTASQLAGRKAMIVKLLVESWPSAAWAMVRDHVSEVGWDKNVLSEEVLASKKLLPGHQFKAPNKLWASRSKVSEASWLALKRLLRDLGKLQKGKARKITRAAFEERLERASLVCLPVVKWRTINEIN